MPKKLTFVEIGNKNINPWAVACVYEDEGNVYVMLTNGVYYTFPKYDGKIIVNDRKLIVSALELATVEGYTDG